MNLVFIYGPPGVGKLSVARELARDNTRLAPAEVAGLIASHYHLPAA
ncbi:MAG TPA: hypothetical protein VF570_11720 [Pyrinomonadaceae bacterium]|jgi:replication-associated recombination protein RarA